MTLAAALPTGRRSASDEFFKVAFACCVLTLCLEVGYLLCCRFPYDPLGYLVGRDFVNTWVGAKLALGGHPGDFFAYEAYSKLLAETFYPGLPMHIWSYPPHILLLIWPFAYLPYMSAYVLYCLVGLSVYVAVVCDREWRVPDLMLLCLAPAALINVWYGQNGFIVSILLIGGWLQIERRPVLAGVMFGLLSIKPQLGLLLPLVLMLTGRWRTVGAAACTIAVLVALTTGIYGAEVWRAYWQDAIPLQRQIVFSGYAPYMDNMPTAFMNAIVAGLPVSAAGWLQSLTLLVTVAAVIWTFSRRRDPELSLALLVVATFTATPYAFNYDMVLFSTLIVRLMHRTDNDRWDYLLMAALWATPFPLGSLEIPLSFPLIFAFGCRLVWRMWTAGQTASNPPFTASLVQPG